MARYVPHWLQGSIITIAKGGNTTSWKPVECMAELPIEAYQHDRIGDGRMPYVQLDLLCHRVSDTSTQAIISVFLQIPWTGTESARRDERAKQASQTQPDGFRLLLEAYRRLDAGNCTHTPSFLGASATIQGLDSWVPGGFVYYIGYTQVPGTQLGNSMIGRGFFYECPPEKQDVIREAFKEALISMGECGVASRSFPNPRHLYWLEESQKIFVTGSFQVSKRPWVWEPVEWIRWGLQEPPEEVFLLDLCDDRG
ncbi:hypothetical protein BO70DRAFT_70694 [Aspergillus heteromorphus CBS 117.55]|uniref:Uncharacterized protein n=1 Tax=Aspergillus heteromorphus CBS 117.55 TaxID=1448321 RepID=A0A317VTW6_9EURO|nr:uncharacterized protein BO70DRAFT_70694 [Aspergillus heteromorphus CBS 117.55]PWY77029.1 hypothetical protein BO70DRAFT_70694 [Aspergillus heteromorphus CBS 117.55]